MAAKYKILTMLIPVFLAACADGGNTSWIVPVASNGGYIAYASGSTVVHYDAAAGIRREMKASGNAHGVTVTPGGDAVFFFTDKGAYKSGDGNTRGRYGFNAWYPADSQTAIEIADYAEDYDPTTDFGHVLARYNPGGGTSGDGCNVLLLWNVKARLGVEVDRCVDKAGLENIATVSPDGGKFVYIKSGSNYLYDIAVKAKTPIGKSYAVFSGDSRLLAYCIINQADQRAGELHLLKIGDMSDSRIDGNVPLSKMSAVSQMQKFSAGADYLFYTRDKGGNDSELVQYAVATGDSWAAVPGTGAVGVDFSVSQAGDFLVYKLDSVLFVFDYVGRASRILHNGWDGDFLIGPDGKNVVLLRQYTHDTQAWVEETAGDIETVSAATGAWHFVSDNAVFGFYRPQRKYQFNPAGDGLLYMAAERYGGKDSHSLGLWDFNTASTRQIRSLDVFDYRQDSFSGVIAYSMRESGSGTGDESTAIYYFDPAKGGKSIKVGTVCTSGCQGLNPRLEGLFQNDSGYISYASENGVFVYDIKAGTNTKL